ncbi:hypothetical protein BD309DRAFT_986795 [Dichomitus squalens]|nr:hypothetical protein BD309DRAFT_986795 [Dichomitus squalens]
MYPYAPRLPPELWSAAIGFATHDVQRTCRLVSMAWSELARPFVFRDIVLEFGVHPIGRVDMIFGHHATNRDRATVLAQFWRCSEFFDHVVEHPSGQLILRAIRSLTVRFLFMDEILHEFDEKMEDVLMDIIGAGVAVMPNLQAFRWTLLDGGEVVMTQHLLDSLARAKLRELSFPFKLLLETYHLPCILQHLTVLRLELQWNERASLDGDLTCCQRELVMSNAETLQELTITSYPDWNCDLPALRNLVIGDLLRAEPDTIRRVLRGSPLLTDLTITGGKAVEANESSLADVLAVLGSMPGELPMLTSFKLLASFADERITPDLQQAALNFLANKTRLRRLHIRLSHAREAWPILEILPRFPDLEVLGVELGHAVLTPEVLGYYDRYSPRKLTDLLLIQEVRVPPADILALFRSRPNLKSLKFVDHPESLLPEERARAPHILAKYAAPWLFAHPPRSLAYLDCSLAA